MSSKRYKKYYSETELKSLLKRAFDEEIKGWKNRYDFEVGYFEDADSMFVLKFDNIEEAASFLFDEFRPDTKGKASCGNPLYPNLIISKIDCSFLPILIHFYFIGKENLSTRWYKLKEGIKIISNRYNLRCLFPDEFLLTWGRGVMIGASSQLLEIIKDFCAMEGLEEEMYSRLIDNIDSNGCRNEYKFSFYIKYNIEREEKKIKTYNVCSFLHYLIDSLPWWCAFVMIDEFSTEERTLSNLNRGGIMYTLITRCEETFQYLSFIWDYKRYGSEGVSLFLNKKGLEKTAVQNLGTLIDTYDPKDEDEKEEF